MQYIRKLITCALMVLLSVYYINLYAVNASFTNSLDQLVAKRLPNANIGIIVGDAKSGRILYQKNSAQFFTPASNAKLFTAAAALYLLKPEYQFRTTISRDAKNVYLTFGGDPTLSSEDLEDLIQALKKQGIQTIDGDIVIDTSAFQEPNHAPGWVHDDVPWNFAAPITALILDDNTITLNITPNPVLGKRPTVAPVNNCTPHTVHNRMITVTNAEAKKHCSTVVHLDQDNHITLEGCWPIGNKRTRTAYLAIRHPVPIAKTIIKDALKENGITLQGKIRTGITPKNVQIIDEHRSAHLFQIVTTMLQDSNNLYADSILKTLGRHDGRSGTFKNGVRTMQKILQEKIGIANDQLVLFDGSGLSRYSLLTPQQIYQLLYALYNDPQLKNLFITSLAVSGSNGTLQYRLQSPETQGQIYAKTGSMKGISALSGYLTTLDKKQLIFSIMINHVHGKIRSAKKLENEICNMLVHIP